MKKENLKTYLILHLILLIYSTGGIFSKSAAAETFLSWKWIVLYGLLMMTLGIYAIGWQQVIKKLSLNTAYINKSVTIIWSMIWGVVFFGEHIRITNLIGGILVITGILLIVTEDKKC